MKAFHHIVLIFIMPILYDIRVMFRFFIFFFEYVPHSILDAFLIYPNVFIRSLWFIKVLYFGKEESLSAEMDLSSLSSSAIRTPKRSHSRLDRHPSASMMKYNSSISMQYNSR
jgi:hypothetical protein